MPVVLVFVALGAGGLFFYRNRVVDSVTTAEGTYELRANGRVLDPYGHVISGMTSEAWERLKSGSPRPDGVL
jgi:hypothetical protein